MSAMIVTLYSRPDCHLCEELKLDLEPLRAQWGFTLVERNIDDDSADYERFRYLIPVLDIEGGPLLYPPHMTWAIEAALRNASTSVPPAQDGAWKQGGPA